MLLLPTIGAYFRVLNIQDQKMVGGFRKVPTLILGGEVDGCMSSQLLDIQRNKLAEIPMSEFRPWQDLGHFLHREDPHKVGEAIVDWLKNHT